MPDGSAFPIIYVRGFAGGTSGIDTATDDPFYGFNDVATHVRVGGDGNPQFYQFEVPWSGSWRTRITTFPCTAASKLPEPVR